MNNLKVSYHKEIFPKIWEDDGTRLKKGVREKLLEIADNFIRFCARPVKVTDISLVGSCVNYNWTDSSDIDLHIEISLDNFKDKKLGHDFLDARNKLYKERHEGGIRIFGALVEITAEDEMNKAQSDAKFSLKQNKWIKKPEYNPPEYDEDKAKELSSFWKKKIENKLKSGDSEELDDLNTEIKDKRNKDLKKNGEWGELNLAMKDLRKRDLIDKVKEVRDKKLKKELSLDK